MTVKDIINYLYRFRSPILILEDESKIIGYTKTKDIIALMNLGIDDPSKIPIETKILNISSINTKEIENHSIFPILNIPNLNIDIISRKELEYLKTNDISTLEINFEAVLRNLPIPILITDRFGKTIWANLNFIEFFSLPEEEIIGKNVLPAIPLKLQKSPNKKSFKIIQSEMIAFDIKVKVIILTP